MIVSVPNVVAPPPAAIQSIAISARYVRIQLALRIDDIKGVGFMLFDHRTERFVRKFKAGAATQSEGYDGRRAWRSDAAGFPRWEDLPEWRDTIATWSDIFVGSQPFRQLRINPREILLTGVHRSRGTRLRLDSTGLHIVSAVRYYAGFRADTRLGDYHRIAGMTVPFTIVSHSQEDNWSARVTHVDALSNVASAAFKPPHPPSDYEPLRGSTTVPMLHRRVPQDLVIPATIGNAAVKLTLDTGGQNVLYSDVAKRLGLSTVGNARVGGGGQALLSSTYTLIPRFRVGAAVLRNQWFLVLPRDVSDGTNGIVGYELLARFRARLDFKRRAVTFSAADAASPRPRNAMPFVFYDRQPVVEGSLDRHRGFFALDSGSSGYVDVKHPFLKSRRLLTFYRPTMYGVAFVGIGGADMGWITRAKSLVLGTAKTHDVLITLLNGSDLYAGDSSIAANVGAAVLGRFMIEFDYLHGWLALQPGGSDEISRHRSKNHAGLLTRFRDGRLVVVRVYRGTPAYEAGLREEMSITQIAGLKIEDSNAERLVTAVFAGRSGKHLTVVTSDGIRHHLTLRILPW